MSSSSSDSSNSDSCNGGSSGSGSDRRSGQSLVSKASLPSKVVVALGASQASKHDVGVDSSRWPHGLSFTSLRVESLGVRRLAQPSLQWGGRF